MPSIYTSLRVKKETKNKLENYKRWLEERLKVGVTINEALEYLLEEVLK